MEKQDIDELMDRIGNAAVSVFPGRVSEITRNIPDDYFNENPIFSFDIDGEMYELTLRKL